jgi:hypothetical protein
MAGARCVYCGAALPAESGARQPSAAPAAGSERLIVVVDLSSGREEDAARALGLTLFDLRQLSLRGPLHLHRVLSPDRARAEAAFVADRGLWVALVSEAETRRVTSPLVVRGGRWVEGTLHAQTADGSLRLCGDDLLLLVQGPIVRERQATPETADLRNVRRLKLVRSATLTQGFRYHLHRCGDPIPIELDPLSFAFGEADGASHSSDQRLAEWISRLAPGVPVDDTFRRQVPALGPAAPASESALRPATSADRGSSRGKGAEAPVLDNLAQFRFYSAWRGLVERTRVGLSAPSDLVLPSQPGP